MNNWSLSRLKEITSKIGSGATPRGGKKTYLESGVSLVRSLNIYDFNFSYKDLAFINDDQALGLSNVEVFSNDILLNITGASVARCCIVPTEILPARVNQHVAIIRVIPELANSKFVYYSINSPNNKNILLSLAQGGATREALTKKTIENFKIQLPPLPIQRKIASILSAYDDLIENNTRRIQILENMAQAIYREWFVNFRFPGHEHVKMVESELGKIPEGWKVVNLTNLVCTQYGYTESAKTEEVGPKYVRGMDINKTSYINWGQVPYCTIDYDKYLKYKLFPKDILVIRMADPGKVGIVERDIEAVFASYLIRLKIKDEKFKPYFLYYLLMSNYYQGYISGASTGTTRKSASAGIITNINFILPSIHIMNSFEDQITDLRKLLNILLDKNEILRHVRDLLLSRLISGELDVSEIEIDRMQVKEKNEL